MYSRALSLLVAGAICWRILQRNELIDSLAAGLGVLLIVSMIWRGDLWARYVLPMGFWESRARDFKQSDRQGTVLTAFGWILLLVMLVMSYI